MTSLILKDIAELQRVAKEFVKGIGKKKKFAFYGKMGVGKTTFIKAICYELGAVDMVNSPTFAIVNEYQSVSGKTIYHVDLYRIKKLEELFDIGYEDYFYSDAYLFIEWPELAEDILPEGITKVIIEEQHNGERLISFQ